jgi:hypothetical protein
MKNPGHPATLVASHPENTSAVKYGVYSSRVREPRAREIAEAVMRAPWASDLDELGALELGRLEALVEALDSAIAATHSAPRRDYVALRLRATKELREWYQQYGMTPHARAHWAATLGSGGLAGEIRRRAESAKERERNGN